MEIIIDLTNKKRDKKNISLLWDISVAERQNSLLNRLPFVRRHQKIERTISLNLCNITIAKELDCEINSLFSIVCNETEYTQSSFPVEISLNQSRSPFQLFIDQKAIKDCKERQQRSTKSYPISFDLVALDENGNQIDSHHEALDVKFVPLDIKPIVKIDIDTERIQYTSQLSEVKIGELIAWVEEVYNYTPRVNINTKIQLFSDGKCCENVLYFKKDGQCVPFIDITLKASRNELKRFEIFMDFSSIANPIEVEKKYIISRQSRFSLEYNPDLLQPLAEEMDSIYVIKDKQGTELKVSMTDEAVGETFFVKNSSAVCLPLYGFVPKSRMQSQVAIDILNIATDSSNKYAGLIVRNLSISDSVLKDVCLLDSREKKIKSVSRIDGDDSEAMQSVQGFFLRNKQEARSRLYLSFDPSEIVDVLGANESCEFEVETLLTFDYCENKDGLNIKDLEFKFFKLPLIWKLRLEPHPEWLCVDYGSSAIVCKYADNFINLKEQKEKLFADEVNKYDKFQEDVLEKGTKFLSSDIIFHTTDEQEVSSLCSEQMEKNPYNTLAVCLSPTSSFIVKNVTMQLPCLKILVGNTYLPENRFYNTFRYPRIEENSGLVKRINASEVKNEEKSLLRVSSLFEESYNILFRYFISPVAGEKRHLNKLVLTYPNTYTPVHLSVIRVVVSKTFPYIRPGYLKFVSESDAVAAYYISHWSEFNEEENIKSKTKETILVYDMGAGTLDITLFDKVVNKTGRIEANIRGKLGTGKAGNYLDFVIAEVVCELLKVQSADIASTKFVPNSGILTERFRLKQAIRSEIKPNLVSGEKVYYNIGNQVYQIETDKIISHPKFLNFLCDVTSEILTQLQNYMGEELTINTVVMSGRSCKLQLLREELKKSLKKLTKSDVHFVEFENADNENQQKTIVAEGAIAQASTFDHEESEVVVKSRRLYASYGLVYKSFGRFIYVELLSHKDIPYNTEIPGEFNGENISVEGTANSEFIRLVQTYMSAEETEKNYNMGDLEFISDMEEYNMANFNRANQLNVRLRLDQNNNISLYVNGRVSRGSTPKGVDLASEITKRSIWPVTI